MLQPIAQAYRAFMFACLVACVDLDKHKLILLL